MVVGRNAHVARDAEGHERDEAGETERGDKDGHRQKEEALDWWVDDGSNRQWEGHCEESDGVDVHAEVEVPPPRALVLFTCVGTRTVVFV